MMARKIGVLTSGGDCPGLNAVLRGVTRAAMALGWEVFGFEDGFEGLLPPSRSLRLDRASTAGIMHLGGTILHTTNKGHFVTKTGRRGKLQVPPGVIEKARATLAEMEISALVVIGGDGSMTTALQLFDAGLPVVGVPKTIDNDLAATSMTFGFDSAVACVAESLDRLHTTATSHRRVIVVEVMGRHAGWIALHGGLAGGADIILIPEIPFDMDRVAEAIGRRDEQGCSSTLMVVAEGAEAAHGEQIYQRQGQGEVRLGGIGEWVAAGVAKRTGKDVRTCVLGHLQRGGAPTTFDRILGTRFGVKAVELIERELWGYMVNFMGDEVGEVPIAHAVERLRRVSPESEIIRAARAVEISFGD